MNKNIQNKEPKSVLIAGYNILNWLYFIIIPILRKKYGTRFIVIAPENTREKYNKILSQNNDVFIARDKKLEESFLNGFGQNIDEEESIARKKEETYGINYMRDVIQQDRSLSTQFLSHASKYIWSKHKLNSSEDLVKLVNGYVKFSEALIKEYDFDVGIIWPVDALCAAMAGVFEGKNIFVTFPYNSKYKSFGFWTSSAFLDNSKLKKHFSNNNIEIKCEEDLLASPESGYIGLEKLDLNYSFKSVLKRILKNIFFRIEFLFLDILKLDFSKKERLSLIRSILFHYNSWRLYKKFEKISYRNIESFNKPFLFYALSLEPEFSVQGRSKEFNNQETIIKQLALNLPSGYELVIKEHVDVGRRDVAFYENLLKIPNIRMAHPTIKGTDLIKKSRAVASLVGTVSLEASLMGKKAIEFSLHSSFSFLPNIMTVTDLTLLDKVLSEVMKETDENAKNIIKTNALSLTKAIENSSFNAGGTPLFYGSKTITEKEAIRAVDLFIEAFLDYINKKV